MKSLIVIMASALLLSGCNSSSRGKGGQADEASDQRVAALEQRIADMDGRLQKIERILEQALGSDREPDPTAVYSVPIQGFPTVGPANAKITIVKAYEFACGFCYRSRATITRLMEEYPGQIKVVYKPFIVHGDVAMVPAMAVCAADKQGKFEVLTDLIWEKAFAERDLGEEKITSLAQLAGLDMARYAEDVRGAECLESMRASVENLSAVGVGGTPTFYINGRVLVGAQPIEAFRELVDEEIAKVDQALAQGQRIENYYRTAVIESGKTEL